MEAEEMCVKKEIRLVFDFTASTTSWSLIRLKGNLFRPSFAPLTVCIYIYNITSYYVQNPGGRLHNNNNNMHSN